MTVLAVPPELEPLASTTLLARFPQLAVAMDSDQMLGLLQSELLDGSGLTAESCPRPKAEIGEDTCWIQYPLQVRAPSGESLEILVLASLFSDRDEAVAYERTCLAPLVERVLWPMTPSPKPTAILDTPAMALSVFPVNGPLPSVVDATNPQRMSGVLRAMHLPYAAVARVELVKFRRTRGCVLRYRVGENADHVVYGKVGYAAAGKLVRDGLDALARRVLHPESVLVPRLLGHASSMDLTLLRGMPGTRPDLSVGCILQQTVDGAALVAASIHGAEVVAGRTRTLKDELDRARDAVALISDCAPALTGWLRTIVDELDAAEAQTRAQPLVFAHGDFTPSQLLLAGSQIGILDFDKLCQAEPALDLGRFLAYLRVALAKYGSRSADTLAQHLTERYRWLGGQPTPSDRLAAYEAASLVRMAARSWLQLKPARLRLVCAVLEERVEHLGL